MRKKEVSQTSMQDSIDTRIIRNTDTNRVQACQWHKDKVDEEDTMETNTGEETTTTNAFKEANLASPK